MANYRKTNVPKAVLNLINQLFELERKVSFLETQPDFQRNFDRLKDLIESDLFRHDGVIGYSYHNPLGEAYDETRTDCDASISGTASGQLHIKEVIKPVIYCTCEENGRALKIIIQKAVVVAGE